MARATRSGISDSRFGGHGVQRGGRSPSCERIGYDPGQISRIENGKRPPTELFARMCDRAFPGRDGWFSELYAESRTWIATPPWFRSWVQHEQMAKALRIWQPSVLSGLLRRRTMPVRSWLSTLA